MSRILIMLSTYNGEKYLEEQLNSIINQETECEVHLYIRDDHSTDNTINILKKYESYDHIQVEYGHNIGCNASFLSMLQHAHGYDYYGFSDQDDIWMSNKIQKAIDGLKTLDLTKPCLYASCSLLVDNEMNELGLTQIDRRGLTFNNVLIQNLMPGHTQVFNQQLVDLINEHTKDYKRVNVHDFWLALHAITFGETYFENTPYTYYRQHTDNELGYAHGLKGWIIQRIKRVIDKKAHLITQQDAYFYELFKDRFTIKQKKEIEGLLFSQRNILTRISYLIKAKVYRQRKFETMLFYILYLFGGYKIDE